MAMRNEDNRSYLIAKIRSYGNGTKGPHRLWTVGLTHAVPNTQENNSSTNNSNARST